MFPNALITGVILAIAAVHFSECGPADLQRTYADYKNSLLKQEGEFLSMFSEVAEDCESTACAMETGLLKEALKTYGRSKTKLSTDYQDCMLPCIRSHKQSTPKIPYHGGSDFSSSSSSE